MTGPGRRPTWTPWDWATLALLLGFWLLWALELAFRLVRS